MTALENAKQAVANKFADKVTTEINAVGELTVEVGTDLLIELCTFLREDSDCLFQELVDLCGVDYLHYGLDEWKTSDSSFTGYSRGVIPGPDNDKPKFVNYIANNKAAANSEDADKQTPYKQTEYLTDANFPEYAKFADKDRRFAVVYHLLSIGNNMRIRIKSYPVGEPPIIPSVIDVWNSANWYEREAFDLFGILFSGHPDLRRILTDYGFIGHPFRKDFPLIGKVEVRYDEKQQRVIYEPVSIEPRVLVPKVIRDDSRYVKS